MTLADLVRLALELRRSLGAERYHADAIYLPLELVALVEESLDGQTIVRNGSQEILFLGMKLMKWDRDEVMVITNQAYGGRTRSRKLTA